MEPIIGQKMEQKILQSEKTIFTTLITLLVPNPILYSLSVI
jgi:hypothetical protein